MKKVIIVGGVAGGASAATRLRRLDENLEIIMFERGEYVSFANCGLPYYIGGEIKEREKLLVQTPKSINDRFNVDVRVNSDVVSIDTDRKVVKVNSLEKGEYEESYDYLILSPGAKPIKPPIKGIDSSKIYTLRNVPDTDKIKKVVDEKGIKSAVIIGGGFIGIEMAENLKERGLDVTLIEAAPHILAPFDSEMVTIAEKELNDRGVSLILNNGVDSFKDNNDLIEVHLKDGSFVESDIVILAIGVAPDTSFIRNTNIELGARGHIIVDEYMRTSASDVYAVGDAILVKDYVSGEDVAIPLAGPANRQGRIAADNIVGRKVAYKGTQGTSILKIFDLVGASTGNNERTLKRLGVDFKTAYIHPMSHASYYPGAKQISIKLIFNKEGKVLGAQAFGYEGVDKFIDVIASVIKLNGTVEDLVELELAYAPPFLSAKSPQNMVGFVAENYLNGTTDITSVNELSEYNSENSTLLDIRETIEVESGSIEGGINIPLNSLRNRMNELPKDKEIIVYCAVGLRGHIASRILTQNGFKVKNLSGGYKTYIQSKYIAKKISKQSNLNTDIQKEEVAVDINSIELDACGLCCPGPLMQVKAKIDTLNTGDVLKVKASDPGFYEDIKSWCKNTGNELMSLDKSCGIIYAEIKKKSKSNVENIDILESSVKLDNLQTMVVFSGDLDKAIASFIIANGAAAMGKKVTMFFTFWGLNILRKNENIKVKKNIIEKAFGFMMPRGSEKLSLSKMNMGGIGAKMIRGIMKKKNVQSLEELMKAAMDNGVNIVACTMSMDIMGIKDEELIDGVNFGGVGYYLGEASESNINLFI
ncbi:DsrE/DsrF/DrsH-like family protein [Clostridium intestinale]|uniref:DsrE/DsrF/DrsH-like family protein n=1 Tax=Clostridium intestinale TaxID=36845 RepID=UPI0028E6A31D|nr:DsrE/DsrF/DrsH-like family protein [Clostridium intestinale]